MKSQSTSNNRIGQYLRRWLGWSILAASAGAANASPGDPITNFTTPLDPCWGTTTTVDTVYTEPGGTRSVTSNPFSSSDVQSAGFNYTHTGLLHTFSMYSTTLPTTSTTSPAAGAVAPSGPSIANGTNTIIYSINGASPTNEVCAYSYVLTSSGTGVLSRTIPVIVTLAAPIVINPTAVPLFTPLGLIATISGLLWFGRRRKAMKVTTG